MRATGYHDLPEFPEVAPDPSDRNVAEASPPSPTHVASSKKEAKNRSFYSESDSSPADEGDFSTNSNFPDFRNLYEQLKILSSFIFRT